MGGRSREQGRGAEAGVETGGRDRCRGRGSRRRQKPGQYGAEAEAGTGCRGREQRQTWGQEQQAVGRWASRASSR